MTNERNYTPQIQAILKDSGYKLDVFSQKNQQAILDLENRITQKQTKKAFNTVAIVLSATKKSNSRQKRLFV
ncbi:MAG: hypothetical protein IKN18_06725, partial [Neisseriaceae bacterium]|nr:hypothetical protein [Neisseriaceae bacterium]